jgi:hypothetical protein
MVIRPKNWKSFQHYSKRKPTWIKLHRALLDDYEFHCLPLASKALAPLLWLLACESTEGEIDADPVKLSFRLRLSEKEVTSALNPLIDSSFFEVVRPASNALAERQQNGVSERETERETDSASALAVVRVLQPEDPPPGLNLEVWSRWVDYRKQIRKPLKPVSMPAAQRELAALGSEQAAAVEYTIAKGWTGLRTPEKSSQPNGSTRGLPRFNPDQP